MKSRRSRLIATSAVFLVAAVVFGGGCTPRPSGPEATAQAFLNAFADRDFERAAGESDRPGVAGDALGQVWATLQAESLEAETGAVRAHGDTGTVQYTYTWHLPKGRVWTYTGELQMGRRGGEWAVRWSNTNVHPQLGETQTMELRANAAPKARVNERSGTDVLIPGVVHRITFDAAGTPDVIGSAQALSAVLARFVPGLTAQSIAESATTRGSAYPVITLRGEEFEDVESALADIPGVSDVDEADLVPTDRGFAPDLIGRVRDAVVGEVDGTAGWSVVAVNRNGIDTGVLTETAPQPVPSLTITLDRRVQEAAQAAVAGRAEQSMMVVIQPSSGAVLAVAQNAAADREGPIALTGLYPPGSTFKMVTAGAAIAGGLATAETLVDCPGRIVIGQRVVPNYNDFALGEVPMSTAFARSCNTTFAKLASEMDSDALTVTASQFGIGADYDIEGLPTETGSVPAATAMVQRTEDGFGQGRVLVSAFGMVMAAATIAHGTTPVPQLISGRETKVHGERREIDPKIVDGLRPMMRSVVTAGTATRIADQGEVFGKTGEAEVIGGSHAWFVGYRGDLAFATLVVRGGSSDHAVAVTRDMLAALPPEF
ncbi:penicillin-binding transpeptidase domain-containing protein [Rhodococcus sp. ABRD24]|uniref:penicillin-binding transpeptidase domain-containing protein n=1 Tax=Rhodococcus sp. ABRD24 TaxID=2507582 RepID=UPI0010402324|nr:penicillin-binding transpeptidase domain-containing protein [Rhodococcus sp. ABRD24]QBJ98050.1 penicillin-binding transpeptidase domain-containing protein [Rhodococcus sp. ABRD24]